MAASSQQTEEIAVLRCDIKNPASKRNRGHGDCLPEKGFAAPHLNQVLAVYVKWHNGEIVADNLASAHSTLKCRRVGA